MRYIKGEVYFPIIIVVCGPTALRDGIEAQLKTAGIIPRRVRSEDFAFR